MFFRSRMRSALVGAGLMLTLLTVGASWSWSRITDPEERAKKDGDGPPAASDLEQFQKARGNGKYGMLLRQFKIPGDKNAGGNYREMGLMRIPRYGSQNDLPGGYWVYVEPYWYIFRDLNAVPPVKRAWGPEQATGSPDTSATGDFGTAWASQSPDGQDEWLMLEYAEPIVPAKVRVHATWNPGAVERITAFQLDGKEVDVWEGTDPTAPGNKMGVSEIPVKVNFLTNRIKVYLGSRQVRGWNEIDAVGLVDAKGKTHWATAADSSSTAANESEQTMAMALLATQQRVRLLEQEIQQMKVMIVEMNSAKK